jgi:hypothetical protein
MSTVQHAHGAGMAEQKGRNMQLVTRETLASAGERILKVKKPDYLGTSKWGFKYAGHMVEAKVADEAWLKRFQNNQENV